MKQKSSGSVEQKDSFKVESKVVLSRKVLFSSFMHSLCEKFKYSCVFKVYFRLIKKIML